MGSLMEKRPSIKQERPDFQLVSRKCPIIDFEFSSENVGKTQVVIVYPRSVPFLSRERMPEPFRAMEQGSRFQSLYLIHGRGGNAYSILKQLEVMQLAVERQLMLIMPTIADTGEDTGFYKKDLMYLTEELPKLVTGIMPVSGNKENTFILGFDEGGDTAADAALLMPGLYGQVYSINGSTSSEFDCPRTIEDYNRAFERALEAMPLKYGTVMD